MIPDGVLPGFVATTGSVLEAPPNATVVDCGAVKLAYWDLTSLTPGLPVLALSRIARTTSGTVPMQQLVDDIRLDPSRLVALLPPLAMVAATDNGVRMLADSMGFRQLYHTDPGAPGQGCMSTSALSITKLHNSQLDEIGVAVQSLLGWQLGQRTLFSGLTKLAPGCIATASEGGVRIEAPRSSAENEIELPDAVRAAAHLLRESLSALLEDYPDAVLQLTGGQDSRLLLSAVPVARRRGLRAMTLGVPGDGDVLVAAQIANRYGLNHKVYDLTGLEELCPEDAWELVRSAAVRLDAMSDPVAFATLAARENRMNQGVRISGLGGEVGRGFYYVGKVKDRPYTRRDAAQLAAWRMFVNEAVEPGMLSPEFAAWAREAAYTEVHTALLAGGHEWFRATDQLYLRHRMQRWAGLSDTAVTYQRIVINPMLDQGFRDIAFRLAPVDKANALFLSRLQMELDPELGSMPLEGGRSAPAAYAHPSTVNRLTNAYSETLRMSRKLAQRLRRANRPPVGAGMLASKVANHWRENPQVLTDGLKGKFLREEWISELLAGKLEPRASSVALLTNLIVANQSSATPRLD